MANDTKSEQPDKNAPMPIGKAIGGLLLLFSATFGSIYLFVKSTIWN